MGIELELSRAHANCDYLNTFTSTRNAKYSGYVVSKVFVPAEGGYFFVENEIIQQIILPPRLHGMTIYFAAVLLLQPWSRLNDFGYFFI